MERWKRAIAGGVAGTTAMAVVLLIGEAETSFAIGTPEAIARYVGFTGGALLAVLAFFLMGMVGWPLVFVAVERRLTALPGGADPAIRGVAFGIPLWVVFVLLSGPAAIEGLSGELLVLHFVFTLFAHLVYGYVLGAVYHTLASGRATAAGA